VNMIELPGAGLQRSRGDVGGALHNSRAIGAR
jgi:hypothetical protein